MRYGDSRGDAYYRNMKNPYAGQKQGYGYYDDYESGTRTPYSEYERSGAETPYSESEYTDESESTYTDDYDSRIDSRNRSPYTEYTRDTRGQSFTRFMAQNPNLPKNQLCTNLQAVFEEGSSYTESSSSDESSTFVDIGCNPNIQANCMNTLFNAQTNVPGIINCEESGPSGQVHLKVNLPLPLQYMDHARSPKKGYNVAYGHKQAYQSLFSEQSEETESRTEEDYVDDYDRRRAYRGERNLQYNERVPAPNDMRLPNRIEIRQQASDSVSGLEGEDGLYQQSIYSQRQKLDLKRDRFEPTRLNLRKPPINDLSMDQVSSPKSRHGLDRIVNKDSPSPRRTYKTFDFSEKEIGGSNIQKDWKVDPIVKSSKHDEDLPLDEKKDWLKGRKQQLDIVEGDSTSRDLHAPIDAAKSRTHVSAWRNTASSIPDAISFDEARPAQSDITGNWNRSETKERGVDYYADLAKRKTSQLEKLKTDKQELIESKKSEEDESIERAYDESVTDDKSYGDESTKLNDTIVMKKESMGALLSMHNADTFTQEYGEKASEDQDGQLEILDDLETTEKPGDEKEVKSPVQTVPSAITMESHALDTPLMSTPTLDTYFGDLKSQSTVAVSTSNGDSVVITIFSVSFILLRGAMKMVFDVVVIVVLWVRHFSGLNGQRTKSGLQIEFSLPPKIDTDKLMQEQTLQSQPTLSVNVPGMMVKEFVPDVPALYESGGDAQIWDVVLIDSTKQGKEASIPTTAWESEKAWADTCNRYEENGNW